MNGVIFWIQSNGNMLHGKLLGSFIIGLLFILHLPLLCEAQYENSYIPLNKTSFHSYDLIKTVRSRTYEELKEIPSARKQYLMSGFYETITNSIVNQIYKGFIIDDDTLQDYIEFTFNTIIRENHLPQRSRTILISNSPFANAVCMGEGTFIITLGLISKSKNESQIAFALAHEIAHYELKHVRFKIERELEKGITKKVRKKTANILLQDDATTEDIDDLKKLVYNETRYNRKLESQADSLAMVYLKNTSYNTTEGLKVLSILDSALYPKYDLGDKWFSAFQFSNFPFQQYWLKPRLSLYSHKPENLFVFSADSLHSHPEILTRQLSLKEDDVYSNYSVNSQSAGLVEITSVIADFECVETTYSKKQYDLCLYYSLQLLSVYPKNSFLTTKISAMLMHLYMEVDKGTNSKFIQDYTAYFSPQLKQVNAFLYNLRKDELGELAYHFLNTRPHFDPNVEMHYYLLWLACKNTQRTTVQQKIELAYKEKYKKKISSYPDPF